MVEKTTRVEHIEYEHIHATPDFQELRHRYRRFAVPWTVAFLVWYLLYVVMNGWATEFMDIKVVGNINVALVFGLLQFVSTFGIAWLYSRHANKELDPIARRLRDEYDREVGPMSESPAPATVRPTSGSEGDA